MGPEGWAFDKFKRAKQAVYPDAERSRLVAETETETADSQFRRDNFKGGTKTGFGLKRKRVMSDEPKLSFKDR